MAEVIDVGDFLNSQVRPLVCSARMLSSNFILGLRSRVLKSRNGTERPLEIYGMLYTC